MLDDNELDILVFVEAELLGWRCDLVQMTGSDPKHFRLNHVSSANLQVGLVLVYQNRYCKVLPGLSV